ncbi:hypothetical protein J7E81_07425 [Bacillus sp. ISL-18]|uniref:hypothetical protein n=1 Tax=Bacillus sp. ISL-18 TaxID=2819118 RepID=UPI001BE94798|nr:hypothetical protein [Bacillus sp. ISL-18]MBT2655083.1 hypothetical protein [Bacillus sp. ISL-18]
MLYYQLSREAQLLLVDHSDEKVAVQYNTNQQPVIMPKIGPRPPYYYNPRYEPYYPLI